VNFIGLSSLKKLFSISELIEASTKNTKTHKMYICWEKLSFFVLVDDGVTAKNFPILKINSTVLKPISSAQIYSMVFWL
jgi:hypothetical protein